MAVSSDFTQSSSYKGYIGWNAYTEALNSKARPAVQIELWLKSHTIPTRVPKVQEVITNTQFEPTEQRDVSTGGIFYGGPELLTVQLQGYVKTPKNASLQYTPKDASGTLITLMAGASYLDVISMYIEGALNRTIGGAWQRKDPDYFISPYGNTYINPVISVWEPQYSTTTAKQQPFSMTLILER